MDPLTTSWVVALIVTVMALPVGIIRTVVYRTGDIDHTRTMRIAATFALTLGLVGLVALMALSLVIVAR